MRFKFVVIAFLLGTGITFASLTKTYRFTSSQLNLQMERIGGKNYTYIELEGCFNTASQYGMPDLPSKDVQFIIPSNKEVSRVRIIALDSTIVSYNILPMPMQKQGTKATGYSFIPEINEYWQTASPGVPALLMRHGVSADAQLATVRLYPVQYHPRSRTLVLYNRITISLETKPALSKTMKVDRDSSAQLRRVKFLSALVENTEDVKPFLETSWAYSNILTLSHSKEKMAIVTTKEFLPAFSKLAEWKTQTGCSTGVYFIENIGSAPELLGFIRQKVSAGCEYILLGGNDDVIPTRDRCYREPMAGSNFTDLYYADCSNEMGADIYSAWNENGNQYYGEPFETSIKVKGLSFINQKEGLLVGNGRGHGGPMVLKTIDGGKHWNELAFFQLGIARDAYFFKNNTVCMVGEFGIARSVDGGISWDVVYKLDGSDFINDIDFYGNQGWAVGKKDTLPLLLKTDDWGQSWKEVEIPKHLLKSRNYLSQVDVVNKSRVWAVGSKYVWKIDLVGEDINIVQDWNDVPNVILYMVDFFDINRGCMIGYGDLRYHVYSRNSSGEWKESPSNLFGADFYAFNITVVDKNKGKAFVVGDKIYSTDDYGLSWKILSTAGRPPLNSRTCVLQSDPNHVWLMGLNSQKNMMLNTANALSNNSQWNQSDVAIEVGDKGVEEWTPDVALGRLPCSSLEEAQIAVDKIITYEKTPPEENYTERALVSAADMEFDPAHDYSCLKNANDVANIWESRAGCQAVRLFNPLSGPLWSGNKLLDANVLSKELQSGYSFIYHLDHGTAAQFGTGYKINNLPSSLDRLWAADIAKLNNQSNAKKQAVIYSASCSVARYIRRLDPNHPSVGGNVAVEFLRNPNAGALAFIGGVDDVRRSYGNTFGGAFAKRFTEVNENTLGESFLLAIQETGIQALAYNIHLLGDPSLSTYNGKLNRFGVIAWDADSRVLKVMVRDAAAKPVANAKVTVYIPCRVLYTALTNKMGVARFPGFQEISGIATLTVTAKNYLTYQKHIPLGKTQASPLPVNSTVPLEATNGAKIKVDALGRIHITYTDSFNTSSVARYAYSLDTGKTWAITSIDPTVGYSTTSPAIATDQASIYAVYLVNKPTEIQCWLTNIVSGNRKKIVAVPNSSLTNPSLSIDENGYAHIVLQQDANLLYYRVKLDNYQLLDSKSCRLSTSNSAYAELTVVDFNIPVVVFQDAGQIFLWLPAKALPQHIADGNKPRIAAKGNSATIGYIKNSKPYLQKAYFTNALANLQTEINISQSSCKDINLLGATALAWIDKDDDIHISVQNKSWTEKKLQSSGNKTTSLYGDLNYASGISALLWLEEDSVSKYLNIHAAPLSKFPSVDNSIFPSVIVTNPQSGELWPMGTVRTLSWYQSKASSNGSLQLSLDAGTTWQKIATLSTIQTGINYYNWEVGRLFNLSRIPQPVGNYPQCIIRVKTGSNEALSDVFSIGKKTAILNFISGFNPVGGEYRTGQDVVTYWEFESEHGLASMEFKLSSKDRVLLKGKTETVTYSAFGNKVHKIYTGSVNWKVPDYASKDAYLDLIAHDTLGNIIQCRSGAFTILASTESKFSVTPIGSKIAVSYTLPCTEYAELAVYDAAGRKVKNLQVGKLETKSHSLLWEGIDDVNHICPAGVYFIRLTTENYTDVRKTILLR